MKDFLELLINWFSGKKNLKNFAAGDIAILAVGISAVIVGIYKITIYVVRRIRHHYLIKDLHPFYSISEIKRATNIYIPTKCQNIAPSRENEPSSSYAFVTKNTLIPFFFKKSIFQ